MNRDESDRRWRCSRQQFRARIGPRKKPKAKTWDERYPEWVQSRGVYKAERKNRAKAERRAAGKRNRDNIRKLGENLKALRDWKEFL